METVEMISSLISTWGFPIVCVVFLWKHITDTQAKTTEALNNNTKIMEKLLVKLDAEDVQE